jgi:hypothetical protein
MNARIRSSGSDEVHGFLEDLVENLGDLFLDRPARRLHLPSDEIRPVEFH